MALSDHGEEIVTMICFRCWTVMACIGFCLSFYLKADVSKFLATVFSHRTYASSPCPRDHPWGIMPLKVSVHIMSRVFEVLLPVDRF